MNARLAWKWTSILALLGFIWGCSANRAELIQPLEYPQTVIPQEVRPQTQPPREQTTGARRKPDMSWTYRVITERELDWIAKKDPDLSPSYTRRILARLNSRAPYYVAEDIRNGKPMKVPNDFTSFRQWTPMPKSIPQAASIPKLIVIVKSIPFLGAYERGRLVADTEICIGKNEDWTRAGVYDVEDKDANHISRSYKNAYGEPAPMPWALRIYGTVWIHAGDIAAGHCSHGCINLPLMPATKIYSWANRGTPVVVLESLGQLRTVFDSNHANCRLYASSCVKKRSVSD